MNADELNNIDDEEEVPVEREPMAEWVPFAILAAMIILGFIAVATQWT